jgi:rRNA maturation endonuclease Nob1
MDPSTWDKVGVAKQKKWRCKKCETDNPSIRTTCAECGHEPVLGRRDVNPEGRKYTPPDE